LHDEEAEFLFNKSGTSTHILRKQSEHIVQMLNSGCIDTLKQIELGNIIKELYDQQGACERIKNYPFPRQYAFFSEFFVWILAIVLPFGLVGELEKLGTAFVWLTIPLSGLFRGFLTSWKLSVIKVKILLRKALTIYP